MLSIRDETLEFGPNASSGYDCIIIHRERGACV